MSSQYGQVLRANPVARKVRAAWPRGQRVEGVARGGPTGRFGTVRRHIPGMNAQGGHLVILWDNGHEGRHSASTLRRA